VIPSTTPSTSLTLVRGLGVMAATAILIGDVIGTGVFLKARVMTCNVGTPGMVIGVWSVAGLLSLAGALTYAELAAMMPRAGGEYVFIREAYGPLPGFLYGWTRFFVASAGGLAGLAAGFAIFFNIVTGGAIEARVTPLHLPGLNVGISGLQSAAVASIAIVTLVNCASVTVSGRIAVFFTALKISLVLAVGLTAAFLAHGTWAHFALSSYAVSCEGVTAAARGGAAGFGAAMLGALWAYNGWNEITYVAEEVKNPQRNLPVAILLGIVVVAGLYILVNALYFYVLSPIEIASLSPSASVASVVVARALGTGGAAILTGAMATSVFGSLLVVSLVSARIPFAMARDGLFFARLARVGQRSRVPVAALLAQGAWAIVLVLSGSYDTITDYAMFAVVIFVGLATASVFIFRRSRPNAERSYRTWGYPVVPALFLVVAAFLVVNTLLTTPGRAFAGLALMACGLPFYWYWSHKRGLETDRGGSP
jgi:APA family basic amino acid/polyamine antiporter